MNHLVFVHPVLIPWPKISAHVPAYQAGYSEDTVSRPPTTPRGVQVPEVRPGRAVRLMTTMLTPPFFLYYALKNLKR